MKGGITGKILWVNLSTGTHEVLEPEQDLYHKYLGGYGIGVRLIYDKQKDDDGTSNPYGKPKQVNQCVAFIPPGIAQGNQQVILNHDSSNFNAGYLFRVSGN